jgi:hypothetical protein
MVNLHGAMVNLHGAMVSLHSAMVSLHSVMVSIHGDLVSLHGAMLSLHGAMLSYNFICSGGLGGVIVPVPVSETTVHNNSIPSRAATNTVIVFAAALEAR